jgi:hypothetical protein
MNSGSENKHNVRRSIVFCSRVMAITHSEDYKGLPIIMFPNFFNFLMNKNGSTLDFYLFNPSVCFFYLPQKIVILRKRITNSCVT